MNAGTRVWAELSDSKQKFLRAAVVTQSNGSSVTVKLDGEKEQLVTVPATAVKLMDSSSQEGVADMTNLLDLHEGALLHNLRLRYMKDEVYTYVGSILVAVNPYKALKVYQPDVVRKYRGSPLGEMPPHIFAIADNAFTWMLKDFQNQCVIISGESGAGKTESTKIILQYLAMLSGKHSQIEERILASSPILESFGNACTVRNNNSSRFGKFIEIQFNEHGVIQGGRINEYLLEKSRIVSQTAKERNYHSFYCLLSGVSDAERKRLRLTKAQDYNILNQGGQFKVDGIDDADDFEKLKTALDNLGCNDAIQQSIWTMLALILHLGNISFAMTDGKDDQASVKNTTALENAAFLMELPAAHVARALTNRTSVTRNETFTTPLNVAQSNDSRDALAKALYSWLFGWLVRNLNEKIEHGSSKCSIGVLDIFGFEDFKTNSFEQLCINYANERLQQFFNQYIFKLEQEEYKKEGINWAEISFVDNQPCLELIAKKPMGILQILDEESMLPKCTDKTFFEKVRKNHEQHPYYSPNKTSDTTFAIIHYAGKVVYTLDGFLEKNRDLLRPDLEKVCLESGFKFMGEMITAGIQDDQAKKAMRQTVNPSKVASAATQAKNKTAAAKFEESLVLLIGVLTSCRPHFVRCVKPNSVKKANVFDEEMILQQLRYSGLLETVKIRQSGYPMRRTFKDFTQRYSLIVKTLDKKLDEKAQCVSIISSVPKVKPAHYQVGQTRIFYREGLETAIESMRTAARLKAAACIQRRVRGHLAVVKYKRTKRCIKKIQKAWRVYASAKKNRGKLLAVVKIQALQRGVRARKAYKKMLASLAVVQAAVRIRLARATVVWLLNQAESRANAEMAVNAHNAEKARLKLIADISGAIAQFKTDTKILDAFKSAFVTSYQLPAIDTRTNIHFTPENVSTVEYSKFVQVYLNSDAEAFSSAPLKQPLLNSLPSNLQATALLLFSCILMLMTDFEKAPNDVNKLGLLAFIIQQGVVTPELRDEIYAQLCKQLTENPRQDVSMVYGIRILTVCMGFFPPSNGLYKYFSRFVNARLPDPLSMFLQHKLHRAHLSGCRTTPPTLLNVVAEVVSARHEVEVMLPNGKLVNVFVDSMTTAREVIIDTMSTVNVTSFPGWQVSFVHEQRRYYVLDDGKHIYDFVPQLTEAMHSKNDTKYPLLLRLSKEYFEPEEIIRDDTIIGLVMEQIKPILKGPTVRLSAFAAANMMAIQRYSSKELDKPAIHLGTALFGTRLSTLPMTEIESYLDKAMTSYRRYENDSGHLKKAFVSAASEINALFGEKFILQCQPAKVEWSKLHGSLAAGAWVELCIDRNGLHFRDSLSNEYLCGLQFEDKVARSTGPDILSVATGDSQQFDFQTAESVKIEQRVQHMISMVRANSKWVKAIAAQTVDGDPTLLEFEVDDTISILERKENDTQWIRGRNKSITGAEPGWFKVDLVVPLLSKPMAIEQRTVAAQANRRSKMLTEPVVLDNNEEWNDAQTDASDAEQSFPNVVIDWATQNYRVEEAKKTKPHGILGTIRRLTAVEAVPIKELTEADVSKVREKLVYSRTIINTPHLKLGLDEEKYAVESFQNIMRFMGDYPTKDTTVDLARSLISRGLDSSALFKTEIFCQILRQITGNPLPVSESKGWQLFLLVSRYFAPSAEYLALVFKWLNNLYGTAYGQTATEIIQNLNTTSKASRKVRPTAEEMTFQELGRPLSITLNFLDRSSKKVTITACTTVAEVMQQMCRKLDINQMLHFGIFYEHDGKQHMCTSDEFILDAIYNNPEPVAANTKAVKQTIKRLFFRKVFWTKGERPSNSNEIHLMFSQMIDLHLLAFHRSTLGECTALAALQVKTAKLDMLGKDATYKEDTYRPLIPPSMWGTIKPDVWISEIDKQLVKYQSMDANTAKHEVLRLSSSWPVYGSSIYHILMPKCDKTALPNEVLLALTPEHMTLLNVGTKIPLLSWTYGEISGWNCGPDRINIRSGSLMEKIQINLKADTIQGPEICYIIGLYVEATAKR